MLLIFALKSNKYINNTFEYIIIICIYCKQAILQGLSLLKAQTMIHLLSLFCCLQCIFPDNLQPCNIALLHSMLSCEGQGVRDACVERCGALNPWHDRLWKRLVEHIKRHKSGGKITAADANLLDRTLGHMCMSSSTKQTFPSAVRWILSIACMP